MKIPRRGQVDSGIRTVKRRLRTTLKAVNEQAGRFLKRGRYAEAEEFVGVGRAIDAFQGKADELLTEWRSLTARPKAQGQQSERTPLWRLYHPILKALASIGGAAEPAELEKALPPFLEGQATPADMAPGACGVPRWRAMVRRARKPMIKEGFLEALRGKRWQLTAAGRHSAEGSAPGEDSRRDRDRA